ncbi:electron transport complex protein RnfG [Pseudidiomarina tainanensis]|uniref:Ion-translocating oxidoreductase complex subunit G n=2 Tax=Pseudidiomarina TaxID=2800384 RepID=A0A368V8M8_9GAMM|nr:MULTISPECIES: electron transport complex subunit RsxG [Pseudidiomarina]PWW15926.1 electron transport complex protein RnfG [Pseudidiomarina maritima]RBP93564.1 electron transport complex protein RnfG [Pseudidiomarina tainanensis]RCW36024.1 electron transport complex protein RnfG [Pseudidiomarina tainanensis]
MIGKSMRHNGMVLALFAIVATLLIMATAQFTEEPIKRQQEQELLQVLNQLIPPELHDNDLYQSCSLVDHAELGPGSHRIYRASLNQQATALAVEVTAPNGYSGAIELLVAFTVAGEVSGVRTLRHQETPGLGDKIEIRKDDWITSFNGLTVQGADDNRWAVTRDGGMFDQFTGATITPRAVVQAVKRANLLFQQQQQQWFAAPNNCAGVSS